MFSFWGEPLNDALTTTTDDEKYPLSSASIRLNHNAKQAHQRCAARALAAALPIVVFGASVSAGCGAEASSHRCHPRFSWARRLHALLHDGGTMNASVQLYAKGAVDPSASAGLNPRVFPSLLPTSPAHPEVAFMRDRLRSLFCSMHALSLRTRRRRARWPCPPRVCVHLLRPRRQHGRHARTDCTRTPRRTAVPSPASLESWACPVLAVLTARAFEPSRGTARSWLSWAGQR